MNFAVMKWKLLICAAVLAAAGCASEQQDSYSQYANFGFHADMIPSPVEGLTTADVDAAYASDEVSTPKVSTQGN
jgi:hypothetical protein